jgi:hypothetical protein
MKGLSERLSHAGQSADCSPMSYPIGIRHYSYVVNSPLFVRGIRRRHGFTVKTRKKRCPFRIREPVTIPGECHPIDGNFA